MPNSLNELNESKMLNTPNTLPLVENPKWKTKNVPLLTFCKGCSSLKNMTTITKLVNRRIVAGLLIAVLVAKYVSCCWEHGGEWMASGSEVKKASEQIGVK